MTPTGTPVGVSCFTGRYAHDGSEATEVTEKFVGYYRLLEALDKPGCPICRCLLEDGRRHLDALLYEQVTDVETRRRLRAAWGLCNWHTWMLPTLGGGMTGAAILHEDLVRVCARRVDALRDGRRSRLARLLRRWRAAAPPDRRTPRPPRPLSPVRRRAAGRDAVSGHRRRVPRAAGIRRGLRAVDRAVPAARRPGDRGGGGRRWPAPPARRHAPEVGRRRTPPRGLRPQPRVPHHAAGVGGGGVGLHGGLRDHGRRRRRLRQRSARG